MTHYEIVKKLIGNIRPLGDASQDEKRFENLKAMCTLANLIIAGIDAVGYDFRNSYEGSVRKAADYAKKFLTEEIGITQ